MMHHPSPLFGTRRPDRLDREPAESFETVTRAPDVELRICRFDGSFTLYARAVGAATWNLQTTYSRLDLPSATQVGVNYQQYGMLVIEAKDKVNTAHAMLPEGQLKTELDAAMDAYTDAAQAWSIKFREFSTYLYAGEEPGKTLIPKYALKTFEHKRSVLNASGNIIRIDDQASLPDAALPLIWAAANMHVDRASSLLNQ